MRIFLLLLFCRVAPAEKYSLKFFFTSSCGVSEFPDFVAVALLNEEEMAYYDSSIKKTELKQDWMSTLLGDRSRQNCMGYSQIFKAETHKFKKRFNHTGGAHVIQQMAGCEWDDETGDINGYQQYGYDGEDFISLDLRTLAWIAPKPQAVLTKHEWDGDKHRSEFWKNFITKTCAEKLKKYLNFWNSSQQRTVLPSVSLLQKTPSSPVSCHATGFYPDRAMMFWRKDGEEIHEGVKKGESLPNNDRTFQMSVDLNVSSVTPEDWRRYDCVFQLSDDNIITRLDKGMIRTNRENQTDITVLVIAAVAFIIVIIIPFKVALMRTKKPPHNTSEGKQMLQSAYHS